MTSDTETAAAVQALQATLASVVVQLDRLWPHLPPLECTWEGTARSTYRLNLEFIHGRFALIEQHLVDARNAATRAVGEV